MISRIGHVAVEVPDLELSVAFFEEFLGLWQVDRQEDTVYLTCNERHHELILRASETRRTAVHHLGLEVVPGTLDAVADKAVSAGGINLGVIEEPGIDRAILIEGPEGHRFKLFQGMKTVAVPPADRIRPQRFEHFNLTASDMPRLHAFLRDGLGFRHSDSVMDEEGTLIDWLHCPVDDADHHGIAVIRWPEAKLHHITFRLRDVTDIVALNDRYADTERALVWGMGRHGTGGSIFSYVEDPSGLMVELGNGMIAIGSDPRWTAPKLWQIDDTRAVDLWGSSVPERWMAHGIPLAANLAIAHPAQS